MNQAKLRKEALDLARTVGTDQVTANMTAAFPQYDFDSDSGTGMDDDDAGIVTTDDGAELVLNVVSCTIDNLRHEPLMQAYISDAVAAVDVSTGHATHPALVKGIEFVVDDGSHPSKFSEWARAAIDAADTAPLAPHIVHCTMRLHHHLITGKSCRSLHHGDYICKPMIVLIAGKP